MAIAGKKQTIDKDLKRITQLEKATSILKAEILTLSALFLLGVWLLVFQAGSEETYTILAIVAIVGGYATYWGE